MMIMRDLVSNSGTNLLLISMIVLVTILIYKNVSNLYL